MLDARARKEETRILLLEGIHESAVESFKAAGFKSIETEKRALDEEEIIKRLPDVDVLGIRSRTQITQRVLASPAAKELLVVGAFCIGTNQIDIKTATASGIPVFNGPYSNTRSVAEMVLGEIIMLLRGVPEKNAQLHRAVWQKGSPNSFEARGKKLGIIGYGNIGTQLGYLAEAVGMRVYFYDVVPKLPHGNVLPVPNLKKLLQDCDVITMHVPETPFTRGMIGAEQFATMKPGCVFINASRGSVVDIAALADALKSGRISGAAIDVFPEEPSCDGDAFCSPLQHLDNVILTPHIAGSTQEAQVHIGEEVSEKLINYVQFGSTNMSVNFPQVSLHGLPGRHRVLHVHKNIPGVMSAINGVFSDLHVNIAGQYLQTNQAIGYAVTDVESEFSADALSKLQAAPGTIRVRVIS
ncbi:MAG: phosphoglycerate dehydrogenase [Candidatus Lokiarchaeota archaeon]|nr:phosphoglycerate dehydrogenase [Candidatus Lokiarchaeota archaeon]